MENRSFSINNKLIKVMVDKDDKSIKVGDYIFDNFNDFIYYVNKLTDIAEEFGEE